MKSGASYVHLDTDFPMKWLWRKAQKEKVNLDKHVN